MSRLRTTLAGVVTGLLTAALALSVTTAVTGPARAVGTGAEAAPSGRWQAAVSSLHRDTVYPGHGDLVVDALHYGLDLTWEKSTRTLVGREALTFRAARTASQLSVELEQALVVDRATLDGRPVTTTRHGYRLVVHAPVTRGSRHVLRLRYAGTPHPVAAPTERGDIPALGLTPMPDGSLWTMQEPFGAYTWYAVDDQPADKAFYDVTVRAPGHWVGISNGRLVSRTRSAGRTVTRWHLGVPASSYLITLAVGDYVHHVAHGVPGLPIDLWTHRGNAHELAVLRYAPKAVTYLQHQVGPYPFPTLGLVAVPSDSAMETETMVTMGDRNGVLTHDNVVHELAHQWYGDTVTPSDWSDLWMNEGMALYLAECRWQARHFHVPTTSLLSGFDSEAAFARRQYGAPAAYDPADFGEINVYAIPALMWDSLRQRIGLARFDALIRAWPATHRHVSSSRAELIRWWSHQTHQDLAPFFHRWLLARAEPAWHDDGSRTAAPTLPLRLPH